MLSNPTKLRTLSPDEFTRLLIQGVDLNSVKIIDNIRSSEGNLGNVNKPISIINSSFANFIFPVMQHRDLRFENCEFQLLEFHEGIVKNLNLINCTINELIFHKSFISTGTILIHNNSIGSFVISTPKKVTKIDIQNNDQMKVLDIECTALSVYISNGLIEEARIVGNIGRTDMSAMDFQKLVLVQQGSLERYDIILSFVKVKESLYFGNANPTFFHLHECNIFKCEIESQNAELSFTNTINEIIFITGNFSSLNVNSENKKVNKINNLRINQAKGTNFSISNADFESLVFDRSHANDGIFASVNIQNFLTLENSNLNRCKFHKVSLSKAEIKFLNTSLAGSELINVEWPSTFYEYKAERKNKPIREKLDILWALKEGYRQIKVLLIQQHNNIDALAFQQNEVKIFWKIINTEFRILKPSTWHYFANWLILGTNRIFSNFGLSLGRPLLWLFFTHSIWFLFLLKHYDLGIKPVMWNFDKEATLEGLGLYFNLLSPVHDTRIGLPPNQISIFGFIDFCMRLTSGYFIYYFIRATRKFNTSV